MITKEFLFSVIRDNNIFKDACTSFFVVDENLHVHFYDDVKIEEQRKQCPGDMLCCANAEKSGCGNHENCMFCNFRNTVNESMKANKKMETEVSFLLKGNDEKCFHIVSTPFECEGDKYAFVLLIDRTEYKRELAMERIFFHDILNLSGAMNGLLECIEPGNTEEMVGLIKQVASQLMEEINSQRDLIYAHKGVLKPNFTEFVAQEAVEYAMKSIAPVALETNGTEIVMESSLTDQKVKSDYALVHRVLVNMLKNAYEASGDGSVVTLKAFNEDDSVVFAVHNKAVIPPNVRRNIFLQNNSSKGSGRGLGTYSMKLIGENYLHGKVWFTSAEGEGTTFYLKINKEMD